MGAKRLMLVVVGIALAVTSLARAEALPFKQKIEVYRDRDGEVMVFALHLEQPFLAEEFESSSYLRLQPLGENAYLAYPKETKFRQKHAAFYGRLRRQGRAKLRLSYETVTENLDGSRRISTRQSDIEVPIPTKEVGHVNIYREWAREQNQHFLSLLKHYPRETFFQYCLLQSRDRYGIGLTQVEGAPGAEPRHETQLEANLYSIFTGSLAIQDALQQQSYSAAPTVGDHNVHISRVASPNLRSLPYETLLEEAAKKGAKPSVHEIARLVPEDQYLLQFGSVDTAWELSDLTKEWGDSVLRLFTIHARHSRLQDKVENQLCLQRDPITQLFADKVITEVAVTGSDPFVYEGTDLSIIFRLKAPKAFEAAAEGWLAQVRQRHPALVERNFNYRGHGVAARYTEDRMVSSFSVRHGEYAIYSNSHVAVRKIVDTCAKRLPTLYDAKDYQYVSTILPPSKEPHTGYFYASEAFLKRQIGPAMKIAEKRRLQCFNNLVMLNNASLFYRLENGKSPDSITDLVKGRFVDPAKLTCPHGGTYAFDAKHDTGTCSLHNRLKYLTPNAELKVLKVSRQEKDEYERYLRRYQRFWQGVFDPIAIRLAVSPERVKLETSVLPFANGSLYTDLRDWVNEAPEPLRVAQAPRSAVLSLGITLGHEQIAEYLRDIPGIPDTLSADPTLTDLNWLGDRVVLHLCDEDSILEIDPTRLSARYGPGSIPVPLQSLAGAAILGTSLPACVAVEVTDRDKAARFLKQLSSRIVLKGGNWMGLPVTFDAYRLPDYKGHAIRVFSYQLYALKLRVHVALIGDRLVGATRAEALHEAIDAAEAKPGEAPAPAHFMLRANLGALDQLKDDLELHWAEKSRLSCHANVMSIYNLVKLYGVPVEKTSLLSEAKYGVTYYCPEGGTYEFDTDRDQVECSVHGNRQNSRQNRGLNRQSSFATVFDKLEEVTASLRFREDSLLTTVEIKRTTAARKK